MIVDATLQIYNEAVKNFLPTPSKSHYLFNLRDFARVIKVGQKLNQIKNKCSKNKLKNFKGVILFNPKVLQKAHTAEDLAANCGKIVRLWTHETYRVFADRIVDINDREFFFNTLKVSFQS